MDLREILLLLAAYSMTINDSAQKAKVIKGMLPNILKLITVEINENVLMFISNK